MNTVALIPAFQPNTNLFNVLEGLRRKNIDRVVVDDGSGEHYRGLFQVATNNAVVLTYRANRGKGHAIKLGLRYIQEHYPEDTVVVTVDANGRHCLDDAARCAAEARRNPHALILGCKSTNDEVVPLPEKIGGTMERASYGLLSGRWLKGNQTGLRAFTADLISFFVEISGERYEYERNVLFACPEHEVDICEVPLQTASQASRCASNFKPLQDSLLLHAGFITFAVVSVVALIVDVALFGAFASSLRWLGVWGIPAANLLARLASATMSYLLNRSLVFRSEESMAKTAARYALCSLGLGFASTLILSVVVGVLGAPALLAKLVVELIVFMGSWLLQNRFVFWRKAR